MQREAMDQQIAVSGLVRTALVVATKLNLDEFREWCELELKGYRGHDVPRYRQVVGRLQAWNPVQGAYIPVRIDHSATRTALTTRAVAQPVRELEDLCNSKQGTLQMPLSDEVLHQVFGQSESYQLGLTPTVILSSTQVVGVLDAIRNVVLEWALRLERDGILGEGMAFTGDEQDRATHHTYNIRTFTGVLGNVSGGSIHVGDYNSIRKELKEAGVPANERAELEEILDEIPKADPAKKAGLVTKGSEWIARNASSIGTLSDTLRGWFDSFKG